MDNEEDEPRNERSDAEEEDVDMRLFKNEIDEVDMDELSENENDCSAICDSGCNQMAWSCKR